MATLLASKPNFALWRRLQPDIIPIHEPPPSDEPARQIVLLIGDLPARPLVVEVAQRLVLGRGGDGKGDGPDIDLRMYGAEQFGVSRRHAALVYQNRHLLVEDLNSQNGTRLNGLSLGKGALVRLRNNDELELGSLRVQVRALPHAR